ncbi:MAG: hypothetical protein ACKVP0_17100 [Pirellulaceae bacterium]
MSYATEVFDPYREWLGIEPHELPADHYRLLGVPPFEPDVGKIAAAADVRMKLIRSNQTGPRGAFTYTLLNEITAAKLCLLSPVAKTQYDRFLQERMNSRNAASAPVQFFPTAVPLKSLPPAYSPYQAAGVPTLEPPLAAPPVVPMAVPLAPPKHVRKSELAVDPNKPPSAEEEAPPKGSRLRVAAVMVVAILLIAGGIWGVGKCLAPPVETTEAPKNPDGSEGTGGEGQPEAKPETPPDPAAKATVVLQEGSGELSLPPSAAVLTGETVLKIEISEHVLRGWNSSDDSATWKFKLQRPGFFKLELTYAAGHDGEDIGLELLLGEEHVHKFHLAPTGAADKFQTVSTTIVVKASGTHLFTIRPTAAVPTDSLTIKSVRLIPVGGQP